MAIAYFSELKVGVCFIIDPNWSVESETPHGSPKSPQDVLERVHENKKRQNVVGLTDRRRGYVSHQTPVIVVNTYRQKKKRIGKSKFANLTLKQARKAGREAAKALSRV